MTLAQYHDICGSALSHSRSFGISTQLTVNLGGIISCASGNQLEDFGQVATLPTVQILYDDRWYAGGVEGIVTEDGWTRFNSNDVLDGLVFLHFRYQHFEYWLSQANYIFSRFKPLSAYGDYYVVEFINFYIRILSTRKEPPTGYLFLCPVMNFQMGPSSFAWPDFPAYWSLDPSGAQRLRPKDARNRGFPTMEFRTEIWTKFWDSSVYAGLRQFHRGKGFEPDSQGVAQNLGYPLYELSDQTNPSFAHVDG
ncbi:hypothetical protein B0H19DRAFT_582797 [Mycena capillaripes]|nr:hypothetical protein B0H19DRAFT_582797 [Mycena capillaripes]